MHSFLPKNFFNLSFFEHASLFDERDPVWMALKRLQFYLESFHLGKIEGTLEQGVTLVHPELISIGHGTIVEAGAYIRGPCIIGKDCEVRHGSYIRGHFITGNKCVIGHATEIKNSIFLDGAHAGHFAYVGDSILGNRVNLGAGAKCANLRFDQKPVSIRLGEKRIETGLRKLGAILGDDAQLGCNSVTNPGVFMGKKSGCFPCVAVQEFIPEGYIVKTSNEKILEPVLF